MKILGNYKGTIGIGVLFSAFCGYSLIAGYPPGQAISNHFFSFSWQMLKVVPSVFILIGLFDVWIRTETVEQHLGRDSNALAYLWAILLAGTTVGGLHIALPIAHALYIKRARLGVVITFLSATTICRVPMTIFEASFLGWKFTVIRFAVALPLIVLMSRLLDYLFERWQYTLPKLDT